jgi:hypothetical protein
VKIQKFAKLFLLAKRKKFGMPIRQKPNKAVKHGKAFVTSAYFRYDSIPG